MVNKQFYTFKIKMTQTARATKRYGSKLFKKGKVYEVRRKLTRAELNYVKSKEGQKNCGYKFISIVRCN